MKIITYNIMFNNFYRTERTTALKKLLKETNADIFCLQEVKSDTLQYFQINFPEYNFVDFSDDRSYKEIIFYKKYLKLVDQELVTLESEMGRTLSFATFKHLDKLFTIATFHLESLDNPRTRRIQLNKLVENVKLNTLNIPVICCGDSNLKSGEPGLSELSFKFIDLGVYYGNTEPTSFGDRFFGTDIKERYDRVWVNCRHNRFEFIGNLKIPGTDYWISDHNGILFEVSF